VIWLTWRLQRTELILLGLMLVGLGGLLWQTHADVVAISNPLPAAECPTLLIGTEGVCPIETSRLYKVINQGLPWLNVLPLIAAILLVLPIVSELENGSYRLAWTQGITRRHWTQIKFGILLLGGFAFAAIFAAAFTWWKSPEDALRGRFSDDAYDFRGILPVGHTLFAIGLMLAAGVLVKRPIPALVIASVAYVGVRIPFMLWIRPRLVSPVTQPLSEIRADEARNVWSIESYWQDSAGKRLENSEFSDFCFPPGVNPTRELHEKCVADYGLVHFRVYHPESHYWPLQLVETGIFLGVGLALIGFAAWWVLRRVE
jgi:hypothetical protein